MPDEKTEVGSVRDWLRHARSDLALARMRKTKTVLHEHLSFHAQQAAEKALKAVLVHHRIRFPRTHDLAYLMNLLPSGVSIPPALIELPLLTKYAVQQRYPGDVPPATLRHRRQAVLLAQNAVAWATHVTRSI